MKATTACMIINVSVWVSTSVAVGIGLYFTRDIKCLWFMFIPALFGGFVTRERSE